MNLAVAALALVASSSSLINSVSGYRGTSLVFSYPQMLETPSNLGSTSTGEYQWRGLNELDADVDMNLALRASQSEFPIRMN